MPFIKAKNRSQFSCEKNSLAEIHLFPYWKRFPFSQNINTKLCTFDYILLHRRNYKETESPRGESVSANKCMLYGMFALNGYYTCFASIGFTILGRSHGLGQ